MLNLVGLVGFVAMVALFGAVVWMHAPLASVVPALATAAALPFVLVWLARRLRAWLPAAGNPRRQVRARWLAAGAGLLVVLAGIGIHWTGWLRDDACGLRALWMSDYSAQVAARRDAAERRLGFRHVCWGDLGRFEVAFKPIEQATRGLDFTPVDLGRTPFARLEPLGGRAETVSGVRSRLYRGFRLPDGHVVTLLEHDMSADGTWPGQRAPQDEPERVNGLAARLSIMEDKTGAAVSHLSWDQGRRGFQLWIDANLVREPLRARLFALAASLPPALPAKDTLR